ncbi:DUF4339 domain-containing protein [Flaviaesturariibacter flavus]|uniref:DUF4339 domain-containing protein n=1 Tax=Flaviaesturariibacter flavus TaxID=2502780 RepID=A0A4V2NWX2_9BACT|nr:DUF4339 domain-containing protein [Flaviaesturariibacter flavus]TCJ19022.1 DUF4339 domain-containing protein [Flaviaesturariibacter flavus]
MKQYLLLRDNAQSGPYVLRELERLTLRPTDLVWIEGESQRWQPVGELAELNSFVATPAPRAFVVPELPVRRPAPVAEEALPEGPHFGEKIRRPRRFHFRPVPRKGSPAWILGLFACLISGATVVEKIMEQPEPQLVAPATMAAQPLPEEQSNERPAGLDYQNAIQKETVTTDSTDKRVSQLSLRSLRKQITIFTNKVRVGIFGDTDDLQVTVANGSEALLGKVNLQVEYFNTNGTPLRQEHYSVYDLKPHTRKILVVPPSRRGQKVRYKLLGVEEAAPAQTTV